MDISNMNDIIKIISVLIFPIIAYIFKLFIGVEKRVRILEVGSKDLELTIEKNVKNILINNKDLQLEFNNTFLKEESFKVAKKELQEQISNVENRMSQIETKLDQHFSELTNLSKSLLKRI